MAGRRRLSSARKDWRNNRAKVNRLQRTQGASDRIDAPIPGQGAQGDSRSANRGGCNPATEEHRDAHDRRFQLSRQTDNPGRQEGLLLGAGARMRREFLTAQPATRVGQLARENGTPQLGLQKLGGRRESAEIELRHPYLSADHWAPIFLTSQPPVKDHRQSRWLGSVSASKARSTVSLLRRHDAHAFPLDGGRSGPPWQYA